MQVAIQDAAGEVVAESAPIAGNSVRMAVVWRGRRDLAALAGQVVRLKFTMRDAALYAFQFRR